jgi:hypothetical protein
MRLPAPRKIAVNVTAVLALLTPAAVAMAVDVPAASATHGAATVYTLPDYNGAATNATTTCANVPSRSTKNHTASTLRVFDDIGCSTAGGSSTYKDIPAGTDVPDYTLKLSMKLL